MLEDKLAKKVNSMTKEEIKRELCKIVKDKNFSAVWTETLNILYSRAYCQLLNIDYLSINSDDFKKAEVYAYYKRRQE